MLTTSTLSSRRVLLLGSGGREHALARALAASPSCGALFVAPGNPGIAVVARCVSLSALEPEAVLRFCREAAIDLVVVGPEAPLVAGLADLLNGAGVTALGPSAAAAQIEASKAHTRALCARLGIAMAPGASFDRPAAARAYAEHLGLPVVLKVDGLAAGKGVTVAHDWPHFDAALGDAMVALRFGEAGRRVVVESFVSGDELSLFALCNGTQSVVLGTARDYKHRDPRGRGPLTGGMGAVSPHPRETPALVAALKALFVDPLLAALAAEGRPYRGVLYAGLMLTAEGPRLLEYNVRFGDPECQCLVARWRGDLAAALAAAASGEPLATPTLVGHAVTVVLADPAYPDPPRDALRLDAVDTLSIHPHAALLHAGTRRDPEGGLFSRGGRVLNAVAWGERPAAARALAYETVAATGLTGLYHRRDVGADEGA